MIMRLAICLAKYIQIRFNNEIKDFNFLISILLYFNYEYQINEKKFTNT